MSEASKARDADIKSRADAYVAGLNGGAAEAELTQKTNLLVLSLNGHRVFCDLLRGGCVAAATYWACRTSADGSKYEAYEWRERPAGAAP